MWLLPLMMKKTFLKFYVSPLFKIILRKVKTLLTFMCNIKNKNCFLPKCGANGMRWLRYAPCCKTQVRFHKNKNCSVDKNQWTSQLWSGNFLASTSKPPMLLPSWINTALGKVKPVRSSSESPWVNYNIWWWHSCVFWKQPGEVRVGHYKPLAFTSGCKRQWGQEASHRDQGAQSPAKNKQAPIVTSAGKYHWSLNSQVPKQREENASVQQAPKRPQNNNYRDWKWSVVVLTLQIKISES